MNESFINVSKNILRRRVMLLIGMIIIIIFNLAFFVINYLIKGNEMLYTIINGLMLLPLIAYLIFYIAKGQKVMFKSLYKLGRIIYLLPVAFYIMLTVFSYLDHKIINYEFIAYAVLSIAMQLITFRFNLRDKDPLKTNLKCVFSGIIGVFLFPIFIGLCFTAKIDISVLDLSRSLKYTLNEDSELTITGMYSGLSKTAKIKDTYYGVEVLNIGEHAFNHTYGIALETVEVGKNIKSIDRYAFSGINHVILNGSPELLENSLYEVNEITFNDITNVCKVSENFFNGTKINTPYELIDEYRQNEYFKYLELNNNIIIAPTVSDDEIYINFDSSMDEYVNTVIVKKGSSLPYDILKNTSTGTNVLYNDTISYEKTQEYYKQRYELGLNVLSSWSDEDNSFKFNTPLSKSCTVSPYYENIVKYTIDFRTNDSDNIDVYTSESMSYQLPSFAEIKSLRNDADAFSNVSYSNGYSVQLDAGNYLDSKITNQYPIYAKWELTKPDSSFELLDNNVAILENEFIDSDNNVSYEKAYNKNDLEIRVAGLHMYLPTAKTTFTYEWINNDGIYSTEQALTMKYANDYEYISATTVEYIDDYGYSHYSTINKEIDLKIDKAQTAINYEFEGVQYDNTNTSLPVLVYDGAYHNVFSSSTNRDGLDIAEDITDVSISYAYKSGNSLNEYKNPSQSAGITTIIFEVLETQNYYGLEYKVDFEIAKRNVEVTLDHSVLKSVYGDELSLEFQTETAHIIQASSGDEGLIDGDDLVVSYEMINNFSNISNAGQYAIAPKIANQNYKLVYDETTYYQLQQRPITLTANAYDVEYGEYEDNNNLYAQLSAESSYYGDSTKVGILANDLNDFTYIVSNPIIATSYLNAGTYNIIQDKMNSNYLVKEYNTNTCTVNQRSITMLVNYKYFTYNGYQQIPTFNYYNVMPNDDVYYTDVFNNINAGTYDEAITTLNNPNYKLKENYYFQYTINQKQLTCEVNPITITYGDLAINNGAEFYGFVEGEDVSVINMSNILFTFGGYQQYSNIGTYKVTASGNLNSNYDITFKESTLTVLPYELTASWSNEVYYYNGINQYPTADISTPLNSDTVTLTYYNYGSKAGDYTVTAVSNNDNYVISSNTSTKDYTINKKDIEAVWGNTEFVYNGKAQHPTATLTGLASGDTICEINYPQGYKDVSANWHYTVSITNDNYNLVNNNIYYRIDPYQLEYVWNNTEVTYNGLYQKPTCTFKTVFDNDNGVISVTQFKDANTYTSVATAEISANYLEPLNYSQEFIINKKSITPVLAESQYSYNGQLIQPNVTFGGAYSNDVINYTIDSNREVGTYESYIEIDNTNYQLANNLVYYEIIPAEITVVWANTALTYNANHQAPSFSYALIGSETSTITLKYYDKASGSYVANTINAGSYYIEASFDNTNYIIKNGKCDYEILKAELTISDEREKGNTTYGYKAEMEFIPVYSGFMGSDDQHSLDWTNMETIYSFGDEEYPDAGEYTYWMEGITSNNYNITVIPNTFIVKPRSIAIEINDIEANLNDDYDLTFELVDGTIFEGEEDDICDALYVDLQSNYNGIYTIKINFELLPNYSIIVKQYGEFTNTF